MQSIRISEIARTKFVSLHPKDKLESVNDIFEKYDIHHIPVLVSEKVVGVISQGDYLAFKRSEEALRLIHCRSLEPYEYLAETIMSSPPIVIDYNCLAYEALELMIEQHINFLPVIKDSKIYGLITSYDLLKVLRVYLLETSS